MMTTDSIEQIERKSNPKAGVERDRPAHDPHARHQYGLQDDLQRGGEQHTARGRAKATDTPGQLRVSFFWIFYSDYNVLAMGDNGGWALVGSRSPKYLWILSRTPHLEQSVLDTILATAAVRGYDISKLIYVEQR